MKEYIAKVAEGENLTRGRSKRGDGHHVKR